MDIAQKLQGSIKIPLPKPFSWKYEDLEERSRTFKTYSRTMEPALAPHLKKIKDTPPEITEEDLTDKGKNH